MRIYGMKIDLYADGTVNVEIPKFSNASRHSNWKTEAAITFVSVAGGKRTMVNATVQCSLGKLAKRKSKNITISKKLSTPIVIDDEGFLRPIVSMKVNRY